MSGGYISVKNGGAYIARFYVKCTGPDGKRVAPYDSGDFTMKDLINHVKYNLDQLILQLRPKRWSSLDTGQIYLSRNTLLW